MGCCGGFIKCLIRQLIIILVACLVILFVPNLPPNAKISEPYTVTPPKTLENVLQVNNKLEFINKLHDEEIFGPEALASYNGELYTSLHGGDIVKLVGKHITPIIKFGKPCKTLHEEKICGRPLGLKFDAEGNLYAIDAYYGIFKVNVKTGEKLKLIDLNEEIEGKKPKLPNGLDISRNGDIYWSDSSNEFELQDGVFDLLADGSGRLIHYNARTKKNTVLLDNIHFANGVVLSDDEEFVLVSETARNKIIKYYIAGPKKGTHESFIDGLPGMPDNLQQDGHGGFLVPLVFSVDESNPSPTQTLGPFPSIRKLLARSLALFELGFKTLNKYYPCDFASKGEHFVGHFASTTFMNPSRSTILHVSKKGEILNSFHSTSKKIGQFSDALIVGDTMYLGSPFNKYVGVIPLNKLGLDELKQTSKPSQQVPTTPKPQTTPPPTTTTKPPTQAPTTTTPKPTQKPSTPPPTQKPTTTTPKPTTTTPKPTTQAPTQKPATPPPSPAQPKQAEPKQQQTPPPKPAAQQQTPPPKPAAQQKPQSTPPPPAVKQTPPPAAKQTPPPAAKQTPPAAAKQTPPPAAKQTPPPTQKPVKN